MVISPAASVECTEQIIAGTLLDGSVLMMTLGYDRKRARYRCQKMQCLPGTLSRRMGEGCGPSPVLPETIFRLGVNLCLCHQPRDLIWILGGWQSSGSRRPYVSGPKFPRAETDRQPPIDLPDVAGNVRPALLAGVPPSWCSELC